MTLWVLIVVGGFIDTMLGLDLPDWTREPLAVTAMAVSLAVGGLVYRLAVPRPGAGWPFAAATATSVLAGLVVALTNPPPGAGELTSYRALFAILCGVGLFVFLFGYAGTALDRLWRSVRIPDDQPV